jgi:Fe-S oxidoreductase
MHKFDPFVLPFTLGLIFLAGCLATKYFTWVKNLPGEEKTKIKKGIFTLKSLKALQEVFSESLLHRKIFKVNPLLGYMHASLAFGWFLLIAAGNVESRFFYHGHSSPPYIPIFFRFFQPHPTNFRYEGLFSFIMDLLLLIILTGVALAWFKRLYSKYFGMKKTTVLLLGDRLALSSLWVIFPLRFLAESFTSASYGGGHFLTSNAGAFLGSFLPAQQLVYPTWWAYSLALGIFFAALPFSRYMHIPTEVLLIFLRRYGVSEKKVTTSFTNIEINSCSRCGVCIDPCQLASVANIKGVQSVYHLQSIRNQATCEDQSMNCLMCGRCDTICPVGIDIKSIRMAQRKQQAIQKENAFSYVSKINVKKADVIYFGGCMTNLLPSVKKSMIDILKEAEINYWFMDETDSICCGRPLMLAGKEAQARELMLKNKALINASGAKTLVTSCPICFKVFNEEYKLNIEVLHHSQYLLRLVEAKQITINRLNTRAVYHDPCELGRGSGIYDQPRKLLNKILHLNSSSQEKENALCCGGSLANLKIASDERKKITLHALQTLTANNPDALITACPACKKTFAISAPITVMDIAEVLSKSMVRKDRRQINRVKIRQDVPEEVEAG